MRVLALALALVAAFAALPVLAHDYAAEGLSIAHPHAFATAPGAPVGGGYLTIRNDGPDAERLLGVRVDAGTARGAQLHEMTMEGDVMRMREVGGGIPIPAGGTVELAPGGLHVMFTGLAATLDEGARFPAILVFERAGEIEVEFAVETRGSDDHDASHGPGQQDGGHEGHD